MLFMSLIPRPSQSNDLTKSGPFAIWPGAIHFQDRVTFVFRSIRIMDEIFRSRYGM